MYRGVEKVGCQLLPVSCRGDVFVLVLVEELYELKSGTGRSVHAGRDELVPLETSGAKPGVVLAVFEEEGCGISRARIICCWVHGLDEGEPKAPREGKSKRSFSRGVREDQSIFVHASLAGMDKLLKKSERNSAICADGMERIAFDISSRYFEAFSSEALDMFLMLSMDSSNAVGFFAMIPIFFSSGRKFQTRRRIKIYLTFV
jgi:hypothetical protein